MCVLSIEQSKRHVKSTIYIKSESHNKKKYTGISKIIRSLAEDLEMDWKDRLTMSRKLKSHVSLRTGKQSFTVISGPHVHKKSRDQYRIENYSGSFKIELTSATEVRNVSKLKQELRRRNIGEGMNISYRYQKDDEIKWKN